MHTLHVRHVYLHLRLMFIVNVDSMFEYVNHYYWLLRWSCPFLVGRFLVELFSQSGYPKRSRLYPASNHQRTILVLKPHVFQLFR